MGFPNCPLLCTTIHPPPNDSWSQYTFSDPPNLAGSAMVVMPLSSLPASKASRQEENRGGEEDSLRSVSLGKIVLELSCEAIQY